MCLEIRLTSPQDLNFNWSLDKSSLFGDVTVWRIYRDWRWRRNFKILEGFPFSSEIKVDYIDGASQQLPHQVNMKVTKVFPNLLPISV